MNQRLTTAILVVGALVGPPDFLLGAETQTVAFCTLIDDLTGIRGRSVTVRGELLGSFRHGFFLAPIDRRSETCPNWPRWGFSRRALLYVRWRGVSPPAEIEGLRELHRAGIFPKVVVTLTGQIEADSRVVTFRLPWRGWLPLIGGYVFDPSIPGGLVVDRVENLATVLPQSTN